MKFGSVPNPEEVDFTLPQDHEDTERILRSGSAGLQEIFVGCAKWNKQDLKKFYPRGTKDELAYYGEQFNSIELNATFYNTYPTDRVELWRDKVPADFKFFPKVHQLVSHIKRLNETDEAAEMFCHSVRAFGEKLGMAFLQLHNNFGPKNMDRVVHFVENFPKDVPLAIELRNTNWFADPEASKDIYALFELHGIANIITDTAGRRDLLHMKLTTPTTFVRYVGANHSSDYSRLDDWLKRIKVWKDLGLEKLYFFVHQNLEKESPYLSHYFIEKLNAELGTNLRLPALPEPVKSMFD